MQRSLMISTAAIAIAASFPYASADNRPCEGSSDTKVTIITPGSINELENGFGQQVIDLLNQTADPNHLNYELVISEGERGEVLASCTIGDNKRLRSENWRKRRVTASVISTFMQSVAGLPSDGDGNLNLTEAAATASTHLDLSKRNVVIIAANKLYRDDRDQAYDFLDGRVPSDGFYALRRHESPFSTEGLEDTLKGAEVYLIGQVEQFATAQHEAAVDRFWANYIASLGGELKSLDGQASSVFSAAMAGRNMSRERFTPASDNAKPEMLIMKPVKLSEVDLSSEVEIRSMSCHSAPIGNQPNDLRLALVWDGSNVDLDLHAANDGPDLNYRRTRTAEGWFEKTTDQAHGIGLNDFEIIGFNQPVQLDDISIAINVYEVQGQAPSPIAATLKGTYGDRCFSVPLAFYVDRGNRGAGIRGESPYWAKVTLAEEIGS